MVRAERFELPTLRVVAACPPVVNENALDRPRIGNGIGDLRFFTRVSLATWLVLAKGPLFRLSPIRVDDALASRRHLLRA